MSNLKLSTFRCDVTPPVGHPLCAGWYGPAKAIADPISAAGIVLTGHEKPVVLCAMDWAEISNLSHIAMRTEIANAVGTTPQRVAIQCTHAHCAPWPDIEAQKLVQDHPDVAQVMEPKWIDQITTELANAIGKSMADSQPVSHVGVGHAAVRKVASNRRVMGPGGRVKHIRWTKMPDAAVRAEPEGLIDPILRTISFWNDDKELAEMHYYAVHPSSYDDDQTVTPDFAGLARDALQTQTPDVMQIYFTGCAGNITAGKYNDGAHENRAVLRDKILDAMIEARESTDKYSVDSFSWDVENVYLPPLDEMTEPALLASVNDESENPRMRNKNAIRLAYVRRMHLPIPISCLTLGDRVKILNLPGESFIEYQLYAQELAQHYFVAVASYGDCGPGYICMERSFDEGGYEPTDSFVAGRSEYIMRHAIEHLMSC